MSEYLSSYPFPRSSSPTPYSSRRITPTEPFPSPNSGRSFGPLDPSLPAWQPAHEYIPSSTPYRHPSSRYNPYPLPSPTLYRSNVPTSLHASGLSKGIEGLQVSQAWRHRSSPSWPSQSSPYIHEDGAFSFTPPNLSPSALGPPFSPRTPSPVKLTSGSADAIYSSSSASDDEDSTARDGADVRGEEAFFGNTVGIAGVFSGDGEALMPEIRCAVDKGFQWKAGREGFIASTYRRNFFQISACADLSAATGTERFGGDVLVQLPHAAKEELRPVASWSLRIEAKVHGEVAPVKLVRFSAQREKGPRQAPPDLPLTLGGHIPTPSSKRSSSSAAASSPALAVFQRLQFQRATGNNGKRPQGSKQEYFILALTLLGHVDADAPGQAPELVAVAQTTSIPIIVRGRSPGHYKLAPTEEDTTPGKKFQGRLNYRSPGKSQPRLTCPTRPRALSSASTATTSTTVSSISAPVTPPPPPRTPPPPAHAALLTPPERPRALSARALTTIDESPSLRRSKRRPMAIDRLLVEDSPPRLSSTSAALADRRTRSLDVLVQACCIASQLEKEEEESRRSAASLHKAQSWSSP